MYEECVKRLKDAAPTVTFPDLEELTRINSKIEEELRSEEQIKNFVEPYSIDPELLEILPPFKIRLSETSKIMDGWRQYLEETPEFEAKVNFDEMHSLLIDMEKIEKIRHEFAHLLPK